MTRAALLIALSDERDQWVRFTLDWARSAYRSGYRAGHDAGYRAGYAQAVTDWKVVAGVSAGGPSFAQLDKRRYPPAGRQSWIIRSGENGAHSNREQRP